MKHIFLFYGYTFIIKLRKSSLGLLYKKILKTPQKSLARITAAKLINMASGDMALLERTINWLGYIVISPLIFIVSIIEMAYLVSGL